MGSNINPEQQLLIAEEMLTDEFRLRRRSGIYRTQAVRVGPETTPFLNRVIEIESSLSFTDLVSRLKEIEKNLGRQPGNKKQVAIDLDVLTYGEEVFTHDHHRIPDPDLLKYRYIAVPLAEMSPDFRHPANGLSMEDILNKITDQAQVKKINEVEDGIKE